MNITETYDYLMLTRRDLWATLESVPDEILSTPLLKGKEHKCIKDFVSHIPAVEDGWIHEDILRQPSIWSQFVAFENLENKGGFAHIKLDILLTYWYEVEQSTKTYFSTLTDNELNREVALHDAQEERYKLEHLLWHVMIHEMRHSAQICVLLREREIKPPSLDLLFYLPLKKTT